jgi:hypothetical protein
MDTCSPIFKIAIFFMSHIIRLNASKRKKRFQNFSLERNRKVNCNLLCYSVFITTIDWMATAKKSLPLYAGVFNWPLELLWAGPKSKRALVAWVRNWFGLQSSMHVTITLLSNRSIALWHWTRPRLSEQGPCLFEQGPPVWAKPHLSEEVPACLNDLIPVATQTPCLCPLVFWNFHFGIHFKLG